MTEDRGAATVEAYVEVQVRGLLLGLPLANVREVLRAPPITRVPEVPSVVRGVANVRGEIVPVVDLAARLGEGAAGEDARLLMIRVGHLDEPVGLLVDSVLRVVEAGVRLEAAPEEARSSLPTGFVLGVANAPDGEAITVLDLDAVLDLNGEGR